jgi:hypothetical protein
LIEKPKHFVSLWNNLYVETSLKNNYMFGLFKKKSEKDKLYEQYQHLLKESHSLSTSNRKLSDQKAYEAEEVMKKLEMLE